MVSDRAIKVLILDHQPGSDPSSPTGSVTLTLKLSLNLSEPLFLPYL